MNPFTGGATLSTFAETKLAHFRAGGKFCPACEFIRGFTRNPFAPAQLPMELLGLPLPVALQLLPETPTIIETAPPASPKRVPIWGELRVVRVTKREAGLELLVARELLGEAKDAVAAS